MTADPTGRETPDERSPRMGIGGLNGTTLSDGPKDEQAGVDGSVIAGQSAPDSDSRPIAECRCNGTGWIARHYLRDCEAAEARVASLAGAIRAWDATLSQFCDGPERDAVRAALDGNEAT